MKISDRESTNVEIECLGKRVSITSPESNAAFACMDEVNSFRDKVGRQSAPENSFYHDSQATNIGLAHFGQVLRRYIDAKNMPSSATLLVGLFKEEDTFAERQHEFESLFQK